MSHNDDADNPYEYMDFDYSETDYLLDHEEKLQMEAREKAASQEERDKKRSQNTGATISPPTYFSLVINLAIVGFVLYMLVMAISAMMD